MSFRTVVISKTAKLDFSLGYLVVRDVESTVKVHLSEISVLLIENPAVSVTAALLDELIAKKTAVIFCDAKRNPYAQLLPLYGAHNASLKLKQQINWSGAAKQLVWTAIVREKILRQAAVLKHRGDRKHEMLLAYAADIRPGDVTNREGHAAKVYFNALFGMAFSREAECPENAMLNYGYSLLLSCVNREIAACGYSTQLGLFHDNMFNAFNLGSDLMEPLRPLVDNEVCNAAPVRFDKAEKQRLLQLLNREVTIDAAKNTLLNAVKLYCKSVFAAIEERDISRIRFPEYEL